MLAAIDAPKSKSITIAFFSLKIMIIGFFFIKGVQAVQNSQCKNQNGSLITSYQILFLVSIIFDSFFLLYFYITASFSRLQYYVFYFIHLLFALFSIAITFSEIQNKGFCSSKQQFLGTALLINVLFLLMSLVAMWSNLYFGLKFIHFGSNIIWVFMWLTQNHHSQAIPTIIVVIHSLLSVTNLVYLNVANIMKKTLLTANLWKFMFMVSIVFMIICYIMIFANGVQRQSVFVGTYKLVGWIQIIPPILLVMFLSTEAGDIRKAMIKKDAKVFLKARQNQNFIADDQH